MIIWACHEEALQAFITGRKDPSALCVPISHIMGNLKRLSVSTMILVLLGSAVVLLFAWRAQPQLKKTGKPSPELRDGDIVFQYSGSAQCPAIAQATHSPYSHCGIVFIEKGDPIVWEAIGPVQKTPYSEWVAHGEKHHVVVKRLKDPSPLSVAHIAAMKAEGEKEMGRPYDIWFDMDEERIYCSELVWKIYQRGARLEVGKLERFGDMDFSGSEAKRILKDRFGTRFPAEQVVITPVSIFRSPLLYTADSIATPPAIP